MPVKLIPFTTRFNSKDWRFYEQTHLTFNQCDKKTNKHKQNKEIVTQVTLKLKKTLSLILLLRASYLSVSTSFTTSYFPLSHRRWKNGSVLPNGL